MYKLRDGVKNNSNSRKHGTNLNKKVSRYMLAYKSGKIYVQKQTNISLTCGYKVHVLNEKYFIGLTR